MIKMANIKEYRVELWEKKVLIIPGLTAKGVESAVKMDIHIREKCSENPRFLLSIEEIGVYEGDIPDVPA